MPEGHLDVLRTLHEWNVDVHAIATDYGYNSMHLAAQHGNLDVMQVQGRNTTISHE